MEDKIIETVTEEVTETKEVSTLEMMEASLNKLQEELKSTQKALEHKEVELKASKSLWFRPEQDKPKKSSQELIDDIFSK